MALGPGSIAFVGFNADGTDNLAFVALEPIPAGTQIHFTDNEWTGSGFNSGESAWSWTATGAIAAGTIVTIDALTAAAPASNLGTVVYTAGTTKDLAAANEIVYAYVGTPAAPTAFLAAVANDTFANGVGTLAGTGLTEGIHAIALAALDADADIAAYVGVRGSNGDFAGFLPLINNPANWISQDNGGDQSAEGTAPDVPFSTATFIADPTAQIVRFAAGSLALSQAEGNGGTTTFTFTVERSGGSTPSGELTFSGSVAAGATDAADFGGTLPMSFSGTIADGATTATVVITVSGDATFEVLETFALALDSVSTPGGIAVLGAARVATGAILNDDAPVIHAGETLASPIVLAGDDQLVIEAGGALVVANDHAITWAGGGDAVLDNAGLVEAEDLLDIVDHATGSLTFNNLAGGVIRGEIDPTAGADAGASVTFNNAGLIETNGRAIETRDVTENGARAVINNLAGGVIQQIFNAGTDLIRPGQNTVVNNWGTIMAAVGSLASGGDLIDFQDGEGGEVNNHAGGWLEGDRHAVTSEDSMTVFNEGTMIGRNGSAVNIDNSGDVEDTVFVTNRGTMEGRSAERADSDGDAIDVDGLLHLDNYGFIGGMGHEGYHSGEPNVSEGIAIGGGAIFNHTGGEIYGYGRGIQVDNSSNSAALGATTIVNAGLIRGDGHGPEGVDPEDAALFDLRGNEAINLLGGYADSLTNEGEILGGVKMGGGADTLVNSGAMTATGGGAVDLGEGDDVLKLLAGSRISGLIGGGAGIDRLDLSGIASGVTVDTRTGTATGAAIGSNVFTGFEKIVLGSGNDKAIGGAGDDWFALGAGNDTAEGGAGFDTLDYSTDTAGIRLDLGSSGKASGSEIGRDSFKGFEAFMLGSGDDRVSGGSAADHVSAGAGEDELDGGGGNDTLDGGADADELDGGGGADSLVGGEGDDELDGGSGNDALDGGEGDDRLDGGAENDTLLGGAGNDMLDAGSGNDGLDGGAGKDSLDGGGGNDILAGGAEDDVLTGGSGKDTFVFAAGFGHDRVKDFTLAGSNADVIEFDADLMADFAAVIDHAQQVGADTVIAFDDDNVLTLVGVKLANLHEDDFRFVA